jgi:hypothetical protein
MTILQNLANEFHPVDKPRHKRLEPTRGNAGKFSDKTRQIIGERDKWLCVKCGSNQIESVPHHVIFKSQGGKGTVDNGVTICLEHHRWAHKGREGRVWFENYRINNLLPKEHSA